jgi:hypothetical protein
MANWKKLAARTVVELAKVLDRDRAWLASGDIVSGKELAEAYGREIGCPDLGFASVRRYAKQLDVPIVLRREIVAQERLSAAVADLDDDDQVELIDRKIAAAVDAYVAGMVELKGPDFRAAVGRQIDAKIYAALQPSAAAIARGITADEVQQWVDDHLAGEMAEQFGRSIDNQFRVVWQAKAEDLVDQKIQAAIVKARPFRLASCRLLVQIAEGLGIVGDDMQTVRNELRAIEQALGLQAENPADPQDPKLMQSLLPA